MVSVPNATDDYVTSSIGMETSVPSKVMEETISSSSVEQDLGLLWVPYVVLTLTLLSLLVASFIHFHIKYRDRYVKRSVLAKAVKLGPDCIVGEEGSPEKRTLDIYPGSFQRVPSGAKTRRLKMFYGNKVDVSAVVVKSMFNSEYERGHYNDGLDISQEDDDIDNYADDKYYHMDGTPRASLQVPKMNSNMEMTSKNVSSNAQKQPKPKYGVSIWTTTAHAKKQSQKEKAQTGL